MIGKISIKKIAQLGLLLALTVVLMFVESLIPPIPTLPPGVKLGLSNIVVMYCLFFLGRSSALAILTLKSIFVLLTRGPVAFLMSFVGGLLSVLIIILLLSLKKNQFSYIMISVCAAVAHNIGQLIVSSIILSSAMSFYYSPVLIISGVVMGIITGTVLKVILPVMSRLNIK